MGSNFAEKFLFILIYIQNNLNDSTLLQELSQLHM